MLNTIQGYLAHKKPPPPPGPPKGPRHGPTGLRFLISEVPLQVKKVDPGMLPGVNAYSWWSTLSF